MKNLFIPRPDQKVIEDTLSTLKAKLSEFGQEQSINEEPVPTETEAKNAIFYRKHSLN